ncbi:MAG TPA: thioredoxin domain-containing protein [Sandaracinaceae bacterium LLY-WYZ-13_1]|nr:thioredoxin domain-containing protein [Sandaracinaceae bacterium LLY-WYZ-13_1]
MNARPRLRLIPLILLGTMSLGASCSGSGETNTGEGDEPEATDDTPRVEQLEEVDVSELTRAERRVWQELINEQLSPCGEPVSVGRCVAEERSCRTCVPAARYLVRLIREGYERQEIEELYDLRYGADEAVEIDVAGAPSRGSPMAPVTIVEFSDFECPYCGRAHPIVQQVLREFEGQVRLVFKHFPLSSHSHAMPAARAAVAAGNQDRFWEMHDLLFEHQRQLEEEDLERYAEQLGLDMERFRADMQSEETQQRVEADKEQGQELGVEGTPTFFIDGRRFREPPSSLAAYIREALDE